MPDTYLLTWNPKKWSWETHELDDQIKAIEREGFFETPEDEGWSCGNRRYLPSGSRIFLMRLGKPPKGIVASGVSLSPEPYPLGHWNEKKEGNAFYIDIKFDIIKREPIISLDDLKALVDRQKPPHVNFNWTPKGGGVKIPDGIAWALEEEWRRRTGVGAQRQPRPVGRPVGR